MRSVKNVIVFGQDDRAISECIAYVNHKRNYSLVGTVGSIEDAKQLTKERASVLVVYARPDVREESHLAIELIKVLSGSGITVQPIY